MVLWYLTSVPVMKIALSTVLCVKVYDTEESKEAVIRYWAVDTSLECFEQDHLVLVSSIWPFVGIVYGGLLFFFVLALGSSQDQLTCTKSWVYQTTGFLYRSYKLGKRSYWEVAIVIRKIAIAFLVFCAQRFDSQLPVVAAGAFITFASQAQIVVKPYRKSFSALNEIEAGSLFVSLLTTLVTVAMRNKTLTSKWTRSMLSAFCGSVNIIALLLFLCVLMGYWVEYLKLRMYDEGALIGPSAGTLRVLTVWIRYQYTRVLRCVFPES